MVYRKHNVLIAISFWAFFGLLGNAGCADDESSPAVTITFPPARSFAVAPTVTVRGTSAPADQTRAIRVNGVAAASDDGFATWIADVPLTQYGPNRMTVEREGVIEPC